MKNSSLPVRRPSRVAAPLLGLCAALAPLPPLLANEESAEVELAPVVVTADLWATPLARIPASVTVLDAAALARHGTGHFGDLVESIPNLTWTGGTSRPRHLQIRGLGENSQYEGETPDSAVRFLVDDLDFTGLGALGGTYDLEQVEVLRGPQAGAFGAHAAGGVVRLVTAAPTPYWTGRVEGTVGDNGRRGVGLAVGGPLHETRPEELSFRLALHQHRDDGFRHNVTVNRQTNARDEFDGRLRMRWQPRGAWTWDATLVGGSTRNGFDDFALDNNGLYTFSDQPGEDHQDALAGSLRGTGNVGVTTRLTTLTTWLRVDSTYSYDDDWTDASYMGFSALDRERRTFTQELRLDGETDGVTERWTVGLYYAVSDEDSDYTNTDPWNIRGLTTTYGAKHLSFFGQTAHRLGSATRLTLGWRGERVDLRGTGQRTRFRAGPGTFDPVVNVTPRFADTLWGGKVTLEHEISPAWQGFASVASGYKVGGINIDARINPLVDPLTYETEHLWNLEAGLRGQALDDRLRGSVTLFQLDRRNTQVRDSAGFGGSYRFFTDNGQGARHRGLEAEGAWQFAGDWTLRGHLALLHGTIDAFTLSNGNTGGGRRLANTPSHGYGLGLHYAPPRGFFAGTDLKGRASFYESNNHDERRSAFTVVHATAGYAWERWTLSLWVRNAFDASYEKRVFFFGNDEAIGYAERRYESRADPRHIGVTLSGRW